MEAGAKPERVGQDHELGQLRDQFEMLQKTSATHIAASRKVAALEAEKTLRAAEEAWRLQSAQSLNEVTQRWEAAESALVEAYATVKSDGDDSDVRGLLREIHSLGATLAGREADLARARTPLEQIRFGISPQSPASNWQPLSNKPPQDESGTSMHNLSCDVMIIFLVVIGAVLLWPRFETALPDWLFCWQAQRVVLQTPAPVPSTLKIEPRMATVARVVNVRAEPNVGAEILADLSRGAQVEILGQSDNADRVQYSSSIGKTVQGWVYASYLSTATNDRGHT